MTNIANIFKIITLVIGAVVVGLGYHAFFESDFNETNKHSDYHKAYCTVKAELLGKTCPPIAYEIVFLSAATIAFIFSIVSSLISLTNQSHNLVSAFKIVDLVFHILAGVFLMIGASLLVVSAVQIYSLVKLVGDNVNRNEFDLYDEKISAGALCLLNGIIYIITGVLAYRTANNSSQDTQEQVYAAKLPQFPQTYGQQNLSPPDYPRHTFGAQNNSNQNYSQQNYTPQNYNKQTPVQQNYASQNYNNQTPVQQNYASQNYNNQTPVQQNYASQNYNNQTPVQQNYASQNYNNQTPFQQNYASQNYNNQTPVKQNYASQNYNNQNYPQRSFTPQNNVPQTYPATHYGGEKY